METHSITREVLPGSDNFAANGSAVEAENNIKNRNQALRCRKGTMKTDITSRNDTNDLTSTTSEPNGLNGRKSRVNGCSKLSLTALALVLVGISGSSLRGDDDKNTDKRWQQLVIDVAEDARTAVATKINLTNALPLRGDTFIENGKIFPGGTIPAGVVVDIDTLPGSIGTWVARGTFNFDFSQAFSGGDPIISSTEYYFFGAPGALNAQDSLMSEGEDSIFSTTHRVVLGGTGIYRGTIGEVKREILGQNTTGFNNVRFTFTIRTPE
jgi:hypothetical protein